jgi:hypothetical protein
MLAAWIHVIRPCTAFVMTSCRVMAFASPATERSPLVIDQVYPVALGSGHS